MSSLVQADRDGLEAGRVGKMRDRVAVHLKLFLFAIHDRESEGIKERFIGEEKKKKKRIKLEVHLRATP